MDGPSGALQAFFSYTKPMEDEGWTNWIRAQLELARSKSPWSLAAKLLLVVDGYDQIVSQVTDPVFVPLFDLDGDDLPSDQLVFVDEYYSVSRPVSENAVLCLLATSEREDTPAGTATDSVRVWSELPAPRYLCDAGRLPNRLPFQLGKTAQWLARASASWASGFGLPAALVSWLRRQCRNVIESVAGRLAGLSRPDARHWRRLLRDFFVRIFARIGRAADCLSAAPANPVRLLPLRSALTPVAPPAFAA